MLDIMKRGIIPIAGRHPGDHRFIYGMVYSCHFSGLGAGAWHL